MKKKETILVISMWVAFYIFVFVVAGRAQVAGNTYTGTVVSYGSGFSTRMRTSNFTLRIKSETPDNDSRRFLGLLQTDGQDALLSAIRNEDRGIFSVGSGLGRTLNVVRETTENGKQKIYIVFERWTQFAEVRGGYRSLDYPFGFIELYMDPATGKGEGTYIAAAKIRWRESTGADGTHVEVEDFATFPARLVNVRGTRAKP